jgi:hypothetical protein
MFSKIGQREIMAEAGGSAVCRFSMPGVSGYRRQIAQFLEPEIGIGSHSRSGSGELNLELRNLHPSGSIVDV